MAYHVTAIVLNYNNWTDTITCAESLLASDYAPLRIVIVDNASPDGSMEYIRKWASGALESWTPSRDSLRPLSHPPHPKPLDACYLREEEIESREVSGHRVVLIEAKENRGYSAGNNLGIRYAQKEGNCDAVWILNNDTVVKRETLSQLVACAKRDSGLGLIGTTLLFYDLPDKIQTFGATFNPWLAVQKHVMAYTPYSHSVVEDFDQSRLDYVVGASMLITSACLEKIGPMPEEYFIYFEEVDMATRCQREGMKIGICTEAIVYHKESVSIKHKNLTASAFSDFYAMRNRLIFTRKYHKGKLPTVYFGLILSLLLRLKRGQMHSVRNLLRILRTPLSKIENLEYRT